MKSGIRICGIGLLLFLASSITTAVPGAGAPTKEAINAASFDPAAAIASPPCEAGVAVEASASGATVSAAECEGRSEAQFSPLIARMQVMLDRAGFSPGVVDGFDGENSRKAIRAFEAANGLSADGTLDEELWRLLMERHRAPPLTDYTITREDVATEFTETIPADYGRKAELDALNYTNVVEMIAERFHMDEDLLRALNRGADFDAPETVVVVADPGEPVAEVEVERVVVDAAAGTVTAYDAQDKALAVYPATVGSRDNPSPSGTHEVTRIVAGPTYTYDPNKNFQQGDNDEVLTIPPGPNGPVGSTWIELSKPTYGIHGTAEPAKIGKTSSHGCVRLTNWDAKELADLVREGTVVAFVAGK